MGEVVRLEVENIFDVWNTAGRPMAVGEMLQFWKEKKAFGLWDLWDSLDRAKADHSSVISGVWRC